MSKSRIAREVDEILSSGTAETYGPGLWHHRARKTRAQIYNERGVSQHSHATKIDEIEDSRRRALTHRLEMVESNLRTLAPRSKGRRDLIDERDELRRQVAGRPASLPKWSEKRGWHGGDRHTLYLFSRANLDRARIKVVFFHSPVINLKAYKQERAGAMHLGQPALTPNLRVPRNRP